MCSKLTIKRPERRQLSLFLTLLLTLRIPVSLLLTLNIFHLLYDAKSS